MFYYPHHIGDYRSHTAHLSNEEDLAYRRLLDMYYDSEQPIPLDTHWVSRRIRMGIEVVSLVLSDFFVRTDEGWRSARCDREIVTYHSKAQTARSNGKKGGRPKTQKKPADNPVGSYPDPIANPVATGSKANQEPEPEPEPIYSVTDVTGGEPPVDRGDHPAPKEEMSDRDKVFFYGVPTLINAGTPEKAARSFLGGLVKQHGEGPVVAALRDCFRLKPIEPLTWLAGKLPPKSGKKTGHSFEGVDYHEGVSEDGTFD